MALQIEIEGDIVASGAVYEFPDHVLTDVAPSYPTYEIVLRNTGGSSITVTTSEQNFDSRRIVLNDLTAPFSIPAGGTVTGEIEIRPRGPLDPDVYRPGVPNGTLDFVWNAGAGSTSVSVGCIQRLRLETPEALPAFPDLDTFSRQWALGLWVFSNAGPSGPNPFGFNPTSIWTTESYQSFFDNFLQPELEAGQKGVVYHSVYGRANVDGNYRLNSSRYLREHSATGIAIYNALPSLLDQVDEYAVDVVNYVGSPFSEPYIEAALAAESLGDYCDNLFTDITPVLNRDRHHLALDTPYGADLPYIGADHPYYGALLMMLGILTTERGKDLRLETRHEALDTHFDASVGFKRCMLSRAWWRTHPGWFSGTDDHASDAQIGDTLILHRWDNPDIIRAAIADSMMDGNKTSSFLGYYWYGLGRTLQQLYDAVKADYEYAGGIATP